MLEYDQTEERYKERVGGKLHIKLLRMPLIVSNTVFLGVRKMSQMLSYPNCRQEEYVILNNGEFSYYCCIDQSKS